jgi:hypothetical protein
MTFNPSKIAAACTLALLSACGGDSQDGQVYPVGPGELQITADNETAIARATVAGGLSVSQIQAATNAGGAGAAPTSVAARAHSLSAVLQRALAAGVKPRMTVASASAHPATASSDTTACGVSGSLATTFDDRDNNGIVSAGDVLTVEFDQCRDSAASLLNGKAVLTLSSVPTAIQIVASADFQNVSSVEGGLTSTIDGTVNVTETDSSTESDTALTVGDLLTVTLASTAYNDVIQFASGMRVTVNQVFAGDRTSLTLAGILQAQSVPGGGVTLQTLAPLVQLGADAYPSTGVLKAKGVQGTLTMTVISAAQVQLQLDTNDDGTYDSTATVGWPTLIP